jgi:GNAT superfamily N-acetyltransferase
MTRVVEWGQHELGLHRDDVLDVYAEAMEVPPAAARTRRPIITSHLERSGLRAIAALDDDGQLVGIAYGYVGERGQWWHDQVRRALSDDDASRWLDDAFEVCELHVRPSLQRTGLGRTLLDRLLEGPPAPTAILTTPDRETRAREFYRAGGWVDLVRNLVFPGDPRAFAVLGKDLHA